MPLVRTIQISASTKIGIWRIAEDENFFREKVSITPKIHHWHKRLQHLAARYLLVELFPDFPMGEIRVMDSQKPYLENNNYHFSLSHCGDYAAAIVSRAGLAGIDIEHFTPKIERIAPKFLEETELQFIVPSARVKHITVCWSAKEAVYKWYGLGGVDFREHIHLQPFDLQNTGIIPCYFVKDGLETAITLHYFVEETYCVAWVVSSS